MKRYRAVVQGVAALAVTAVVALGAGGVVRLFLWSSGLGG